MIPLRFAARLGSSSLSTHRRLLSSTASSTAFLASPSLDEWIASPPTVCLADSLNLDHLSDLFVTLPTRDGSRKPFEQPRIGSPISYGQHLAFFHARTSEAHLRKDGTDEEISPPAPFLQRMWAGGKITWDIDNPLLVGTNAKSTASVHSVLKKGFEKGRPLVFITQKINFTMDGKSTPSVVEERQHVYLPEGREKRKEPRLVPDIPSSSDFSFQYTPTPVTLFRFSALMFNAHHIHLDKDYTQKVEGYPERLVHGPLTAMMIPEALVFNYPMAHLREFEYRATNPLYVNRQLTIHGTWINSSTAKMWCVDDEGVVGMTGIIRTAE